jgi:hypothetical protein
MACFLTSFLSKYHSEWTMYLYQCTHSSDTPGLSWGVRSHSFVYLDDMLIMLLVDFCTTYIINLLLCIADLRFIPQWHTPFWVASYSTKPHIFGNWTYCILIHTSRNYVTLAIKSHFHDWDIGLTHATYMQMRLHSQGEIHSGRVYLTFL